MATFLSNGWLSSSQIDMALSSIATRQLRISGEQERCHYLIGTTILSELLSSSPLLHNLPHKALPPDSYSLHAPRDLQCAGAHLARHGEVVFIAYSPPGHWAAISVTSKGTLEWADSLGRCTPSTLITGVQNWLRYHLSLYSFTLGDNFPCSQQSNGYSCGIMALNAIRHRIFGDALWCKKNRSQLCIKEFIDIMRMCDQIGGQKVCFHIFRLSMQHAYNVSIHQGCAPSLSDLNPLDSTLEPPLCTISFASPSDSSFPLPPIATLDVIDLSSDYSSENASSATLIEVDELCSSSPSYPSSPAKPATAMKGGLHSYFPTVHTGKRSHSQSEQPPQPSVKRVHMEPMPMTPPSSKPSTARTRRHLEELGQSAANKVALNNAVKAGTFEHDDRKWSAFKSKILAIDPQSEVDDTNSRRARDVLHVKCGKWIRMAMVYDTTLCKRHVQNCKSRTAKAGMHTLDQGLNFVFIQQPGSSSVCDKSPAVWPCPGLSEDDDPQIETYLLRTTVSSAGGISVNAVSEQMYNTPYKNLTEEQKQNVRVGQVHTHRWSLDHQRRQVFAIGEECCLQKVHLNSRKPLPCSACKALLGDHAFQTAINREVPDDVNRKFTPLLYQAAEIAKICAKHSGLGTIFDKVKYSL